MITRFGLLTLSAGVLLVNGPNPRVFRADIVGSIP
jgi:hypothetical protein